MASFSDALQLLLIAEGRYSSDPVDVGGETYCGISRRYHPDWSGWIIIDSRKSDETFPACLEQEAQLHMSIRFFYKHRYWDYFWGDRMMSDKLAERMLNVAVNLGPARAVLYLQRALNVLNRNEVLYADILEDGVYGPVTHNALKDYMQRFGVDYLLKVILIFQGIHYLEYMKKTPIQEKFARGWLNRLKIDVR